jgi:hypothetical protein
MITLKSLLLPMWLLVLVGLVSCGPWFDGLRSPNTVKNRFARRVAQGPGTLIRLSEMTPFGYKTAHIFGPYTEVALIQSWLDIEADEAARLARGIEQRDDIHLLVFSFQHAPLESMELPRSQVDFAPEVAKCAVVLDEAVFVVKEGGIVGLAPGVTCGEPSQL